MSSTDQVSLRFEDSAVTALSVGGAICYVLWGCLHLWAAYAVYQYEADGSIA